MSDNYFDYLIIGAGAAGLNLVLAMLDHPHFDNKSVLVLDKDDKASNDRTWCFWEQGDGKWDKLTHHSWEFGSVYTLDEHVDLDLGLYRYKMLRSSKFYDEARKRIDTADNVLWQVDDVEAVKHTGSSMTVKGARATYQAGHVFDSRVPSAFNASQDKSIRILQHFKGWYIKTVADVFYPDRFTMMDFRLPYKDQTYFTYVLPTGSHTALVEATWFTESLVEKDVYDQMLKTYLKEVANLDNYTIEEEESGVIPMSNFPFHKQHSRGITLIGTAGGWVKPSTGYSFKNAERNSKMVVENIVAGKSPHQGLFSKKSRKYDDIFLQVLKDRNELGSRLFSDMYRSSPAHLIFKFLDEQTSLAEDLKIISSFPPTPFIQALLKTLTR